MVQGYKNDRSESYKGCIELLGVVLGWRQISRGGTTAEFGHPE